MLPPTSYRPRLTPPAWRAPSRGGARGGVHCGALQALARPLAVPACTAQTGAYLSLISGSQARAEPQARRLILDVILCVRQLDGERDCEERSMAHVYVHRSVLFP